jgi:hypothetical protein
MAEQKSKNKTEEEFEIEGKKETFSLPPGSSRTALQNYQSARRKEIDVTPSPPSAPPILGDWRITLADRLTKERCSRRIQVAGHSRSTPYVNLPEVWVLWWYSNYKDKKAIAPIVDLEFSEDKSEIRIRKRPPAEGMEKSIYDDHNNVPSIFAVDSDEYAARTEEEKAREEKAI